MSAKSWKVAAATALLCASTYAAAVPLPLTLFDVPDGDEVQQTSNRPCIFGDNSCTASGLGAYVQFPSGGSNQTYQETSFSYTVNQIIGVLGSNTFFIGIDVNTTNAASEVLDYFHVYRNGVEIYGYEGDQNLAQAVDLANGNGWSDWFLKEVSLAGFAGTDAITFDVRVTGAVDGTEQFFLVATTNGNPPPGEIPEPGILALLGLGLAMAGVYRRRPSPQ